jgi:hypothetical protein
VRRTRRSPMAERPHTASQQETSRLTCLECRTVSDDSARGWRAYVGGDVDGEPIQVGVYCPACAEREFGRD